ncbi:MAG TPA: LysM peptidoglycan-binding domain-containing protein [Herpetosiphonaceae bacterium]
MQRLTWYKRLWLRLLISALAPALVACGGAVLEGRPTVQPVVRLTPAPTQDVGATQTAYSMRSIPTPTPAGLYVVRPGDTLGKIADNFETTVDEIMALNSIADPNKIEVGQQLTIPTLLTPTAESDESLTPTP